MAASDPPSSRGDLRDYHAKRDFDTTSEPRGEQAGDVADGARLFVVQKHAASRLHYDFRLAHDGVLKSWAVPKGPSLDPSQKPLAVQTEDHPMEYGDFEGVIPEGQYGAGTVMVWDRGTWHPLDDDPDEAFNRGDLKFVLEGEKLNGEYALVRMSLKAKDNKDGRNWLLIKKKDAHARPISEFNPIGELPRSVLTGRTLEEIAADRDSIWTPDGAETVGEVTPRERRDSSNADILTRIDSAAPADLPQFIKPKLAQADDVPPRGEEWLNEIKFDGYRLLCRVDTAADAADRVRLLTRNDNDWTDRFVDLARAAARLPVQNAILDGEVVVLNQRGIADFQALQNAFRGYTRHRFTYFAFDLLHLDGHDLRQAPLIERKAALQVLLDRARTVQPTIQYCDHIVGRGEIVYQQARENQLEGIIAKRANSRYDSRRNDAWLKIKCANRDDFIIVGYTEPGGSRSGFGALLLGQYNRDGALVYTGRVGTGFSDDQLSDLRAQLQSIARDDPPVIDPQRDPEANKQPPIITWVQPQMIASVEYTTWTGDDVIRHPSFKGLREDIKPPQVRLNAAVKQSDNAPAVVKHAATVTKPNAPEDAMIAGIRISNPDRTVYPDAGVTKLQVAAYYEQIADHILPFITNRPLAVVRCPLGLAGESFYQRSPGKGFPDPISSKKIGTDEGIIIQDLDGLLSLVQMGVLEIHAWGCRADRPDRPDTLTFDLDPGENITWPHVVEAAKFIRDYLARLGLPSFIKTTGGNGAHLVTPITRRLTWTQLKTFAHNIAKDLVRLAPKNFVATVSKDMRKNRIFIDYLRNQEGATAVAAFSTRAREGATVSLPLRWEDVNAEIPPRSFTVLTAAEYLGGRADPWSDFTDSVPTVTAAMLERVRR